MYQGQAPMSTLAGSQIQQQSAAQAQPFVAQPKKPRRRVLTSLTLEVFVYFGGWWDVFYFIVNIIVFVWKGVNLPYPNRNFAMEFSFSWLWHLIEIPRLYLISRGNKTERAAPLFFSMVVALPLLAMYIYFINFQTYTLKIDLILNGGALAFMGIQLIFSLITAVSFLMSPKFAA